MDRWRQLEKQEVPYVAWEKNWPIALTVFRAVDLKWRKSWPAYEIRFLCGRFGGSRKKRQMVFHDADWIVLNELFFFFFLFSFFLRCIMARGTPVKIQRHEQGPKIRDLSLGPALDEIYSTCSGSDS